MDKLVLSTEVSKTGANPVLTEWNFIKSEVIRNIQPRDTKYHVKLEA